MHPRLATGARFVLGDWAFAGTIGNGSFAKGKPRAFL
jgi:hypothetical protein